MSWNHINSIRKIHKCSVQGCDNTRKSPGLCRRHWQQVYRYGDIQAFNYKTPNRVTINGEIAKMVLYKGITNIPIAEVTFDAEDIPKVSGYKWGLSGGYAKNSSYTFAEKIMGSKWVDHMNLDKLDNRKSNLRKVTQQQNNFNKWKPIKKTKSRYKGVIASPETPNMPWRARIKLDGIGYHIGRYANEEEAAWMYDQWASQLFGEYAKLNFHYLLPV